MRILPLFAAIAASGSAADTTMLQPPAPDCRVAATIMVPAKVENGRPIERPKRAYRFSDGSIMFMGKLSVDADGSPRAYHPVSSRGLDALGNGGRPGNWWGVATHNCRRTGTPAIQGANDPAPGFYISMTAMNNPRAGGTCRNTQRYVDAETIPYAALPAAIGSVGRDGRAPLVAALSPRSNEPVFAVQADNPPPYGIGEGSIEMARRLGYRGDPRNGGTSRREIVWLVLPQRMGFPQNAAAVDEAGRSSFEAWGGRVRLEACSAVIRGLPL